MVRIYSIISSLGLLLLFMLAAFDGNLFIKDKCVTWSDKQYVTLRDFKGNPEIFSKHGAAIYTDIKYRLLHGKNPDTISATAYFSEKRSWARKLLRDNNYVLEHEMIHFDISELLARRFRMESGSLVGSPGLKYLDSVFYLNREIAFNVQEIYDLDTRHGRDKKKQAVWDKTIKRLISLTDRYADTIVWSGSNKSDGQDTVTFEARPVIAYLFYTLVICMDAKVLTQSYPNGTLRSEALYLNGKLEGPYYDYYEDGSIHKYIEYHRGQRNGGTYEYDIHGDLISELQYKDNKIVDGKKP
jgi:hypothetical protein